MNPWVLLGGVLALIAAAFGGYHFGHRTEKTTCERDSLRVENTAQRSVLDFLQEARAQEIASQAATNRIADAYEKGKTDAQAHADSVVAGLRAGNLRLRNQWQGCQAGLSKASATAGELDAAQRSREESVGRILGIAAACDAQVRGLQDYARQVSGLNMEN